MTLTTQTNDTAEASPCWVTVLFSHRGATDGDESGLAGKVWDSHTQSFCVPVQSFKSQQRLIHADHPSTLQPCFLPSSSRSCVPSSDPRYDDGEGCALPNSGAAMWKTEPMRRKNRRKAARSSGMRSNCIISHRWW